MLKTEQVGDALHDWPAFITCTGAFTGIPNRDDRIGMTDDDFHNTGVAVALVSRRHARTADGHVGDIPTSRNQDIFTSRRVFQLKCDRQRAQGNGFSV